MHGAFDNLLVRKVKLIHKNMQRLSTTGCYQLPNGSVDLYLVVVEVYVITVKDHPASCSRCSGVCSQWSLQLVFNEMWDSQCSSPRADDVDVIPVRQPPQTHQDKTYGLPCPWWPCDTDSFFSTWHQVQLLLGQNKIGQPMAKFWHCLPFCPDLHTRGDRTMHSDLGGWSHEPVNWASILSDENWGNPAFSLHVFYKNHGQMHYQT